MLFTRSMVARDEWLVRLHTLWLFQRLLRYSLEDPFQRSYLDGLQAADKGDLSKLEQLVLECFESQFDDLARKALRSNRLVFVRCRTEKIYSRDVFYRAVKLETARGRVDD